jgi:hypothetical protein
MKRQVLVGVGLILGLCIGVTWVLTTDQPLDPVERAMQQIPIGTSRADALRILSDAQHHLECPYPSGKVHDLFFYGADNFEEATVVIVGSEVVSNELRVYKIGTFDTYALRTVYRDCVANDASSSP